MNIEQYVTAYRADHDRIKALLPAGYASLRPVLRINVEVCGGAGGFLRLEFNTPVERAGRRGWLNLITWENRRGGPAAFAELTAGTDGTRTAFSARADGGPLLDIAFVREGRVGGCPREDDNQGTFSLTAAGETAGFRPVELISAPKEYCGCTFSWAARAPEGCPPWVRAGMSIPSEMTLGAYVVSFERADAPLRF